MSGLVSVGYFLLSVIVSLLTFVLWMRFALRCFRVSALHPVSHNIIQLTNPMVRFIHQAVTSIRIPVNRYDWPALILIFALEIIKFSCIGLLFSPLMLPWSSIFLFALAEMITEPCNLFFYAIIIRVIISWVNPHWQHPGAYFVFLITEPLLSAIRRHLPMFSGIDFSPLIAILFLKTIPLFISASLPLQAF